jgi:hypothetical protein
MGRPLVDTESGRGRLLAKLTRELLATRQYATVGELVDDIKLTCKHHRIGWTNDDISDALRLLLSNRPLAGAHTARIIPARAGDPGPVTRDEAAAILRRLGVQV